MGGDAGDLADYSSERNNGVHEDEGQWEDVESSDEETFFLDPEGRVPFAGEVNYDFRSAPGALEDSLSKPGILDGLIQDCQTVFSARAKKLEYSTGETFWVQADAEPRNSLEMLALDIFRAHTRKARFNKANSGAEWWTQVIEDADDIGWHWDKDYGMEQQGINVHPCLATVTYLSTNGGPTVILEKQGPMACADVGGVSGEAAKVWLSMPRLGKHISFDGRYLHAAPADVARRCVSVSGAAASPSGASSSSVGAPSGVKRGQDGEPKGSASLAGGVSNESGTRRRVTFLVNVWLNHTPRSAVPLPDATAASLKSGGLDLNLSVDEAFTAPTAINVTAEAGAENGEGAGAESGAGASSGEKDGKNCCTANCSSACTGYDKEGRFASGTFTKNIDEDVRNVRAITQEATPAESKPGMRKTGEERRSSVVDGALTGACDNRGRYEKSVVPMRWEFGEVGADAEEQVHLRHQVVMPVPASLMSPSGVSRGESFCLDFRLAGNRPRVSRIGGGNDADEFDSGDDDEEEDEEEEEEEEEEEDN